MKMTYIPSGLTGGLLQSEVMSSSLGLTNKTFNRNPASQTGCLEFERSVSGKEGLLKDTTELEIIFELVILNSTWRTPLMLSLSFSCLKHLQQGH